MALKVHATLDSTGAWTFTNSKSKVIARLCFCNDYREKDGQEALATVIQTTLSNGLLKTLRTKPRPGGPAKETMEQKHH